jgi:hypothetical protein
MTLKKNKKQDKTKSPMMLCQRKEIPMPFKKIPRIADIK